MNNRTPLLVVVALLLVAIGIIIGQRGNQTPPPVRQTIRIEAPSNPRTVPPVQPAQVPQASNRTPAPPPGYGTTDQAIAAYKTIAGTCTDTIRQGLAELRRVSQNIPPDIDTNLSSRESWAQQAATAAAYITGGSQAAADIEDVPPSCYESHRLLIDVSRRGTTFAQTYIANVKSIKDGATAPIVDQQARELEASLAAFDASLVSLR